jgi:hypothetical protein
MEKTAMKPHELRMPFAGRRRWGAVAFMAVLALAALVTACGEDSEERTARTKPADHVSFWPSLRVAGDEVESYATLSAMARNADAVVMGTFKSFSPSRTIRGDAPEDVVVYAKGELEIQRTLVKAAPSSTVALEFILPPGEPDALVDQLNATLPREPMLVFLRAKRGKGEAGLFRVVNSRGLWAATERSAVDTPLAEESAMSSGLYAKERAGVQSVGELATRLTTR